MDAIATPHDIIAFWKEAGPERWFAKDEAFDAQITRRFRATWEAAAAGALDDWAAAPDGALALLLVLDQFPRNMFRGTPQVYATDAKALAIARAAIAAGHLRAFEPPMTRFFVLPLTHAEDLAAQDESVALNEALGDADGLHWARHHRDIVARFGRFPHRNAILGRDTTPEEAAFLEENAFRG
ncbi:DUF924 family protein [Salinarimonas sp.]|uniref:DUF924 family protein n=1 Tax=Salinarimonas sp. TaxID=2766526 RepID=UPI00391BC50B